MSCGCSSGSGYDGGIYGGVCDTDTPYPSVSHESVPSLIDNLVYALYGVIEKDVTSGKVVWNIPCDPSNIPATINGIPRNDGEGLLCYIVRALNLTTPSGFVTVNGVQTLTNKTLTAPVINTATINNLTATGTLTGTATTAVNIAGGLAGSIPYQTGAGLTALLPQGTAGQVLSTNGSGSLGWITNSTTSSATNNINGGTAGVVVYQTGVNTTGFTAAGTSGQVLLSNGTSAPTWSTNIAGQAGSVANGSVTPAKLSTGGPSWDASSNVGVAGTITSGASVVANSSVFGAGASLVNTGAGGRSWTINSNGSSNTGGAGAFIIYDATAVATRLIIGTTGVIDTQGNPITNCPTTAKAWVNFNGLTAGTFAGGASTISRTAGSTTATITTTNDHGLTGGVLYVSATGLTTGYYGISSIVSSKVFTILTNATTAISGAAATIAVSPIRSQYNVSSVSKAAAGDYWINFKTPCADANYAVSVTGSITSEARSGYIGYEGDNSGSRSQAGFRIGFTNTATNGAPFSGNVIVFGN